MYKSIFKIPIIIYAAARWAYRINAYHSRQLIQTQRYTLLTKVYRTTSIDALCVIAGATPIAFVLKQRNSLYLRKCRNIHHLNKQYTPQPNQIMLEADRIKQDIKNETLLRGRKNEIP